MKIYKCADGTEYICFGTGGYTVDDVIAFLEQHRGKKIYTGALENPCLQISDEWVQLEEEEYFSMEYLPEEDPQLADDVFEFFHNEKGSIAYEKDRLGKNNSGDEAADEQLSIDGFFDKGGDE